MDTEVTLRQKTLLPVSQHFKSPGHLLDAFGRSNIYIIDHNPSWKENQRQKRESFWTLQNMLYSFPVVLLWNACACCNWRHHLQRLSPHGLCWATVDEGLPRNTKKKKDQFGTQMFIGSSTMNVSIFSHFITYILNTSKAK
jgi:hypothetical protein